MSDETLESDGGPPVPGARYLVRFDDICPTMDWPVWDRIEAILDECSVRPIVAVVPDNRDPELVVSEPRRDFWDRARGWQDRGWTIALHGYQHVCTSRSGGILGVSDRSEFAGVARDEQEAKLASAVGILRKQRLAPMVWAAPGHSFDLNTLQLLRGLGIDIVSDGFGSQAHRDLEGRLWIPQQLEAFAERRTGVWTVRYRHNGWDVAAIDRLRGHLCDYASRLISVSDVRRSYGDRNETRADRLEAALMRGQSKLRRQLARIAHRAPGRRT